MRVTHPFSSKGFVQSLVNQFLAVEGFKDILDTEKTAHDLVQEFDGYVKEKRFLIVLTDLCTIEEWDQIEKCLPNNNKGSRIIVSTTQVEVASLCAGQDSQASELSNCLPITRFMHSMTRFLKMKWFPWIQYLAQMWSLPVQMPKQWPLVR